MLLPFRRCCNNITNAIVWVKIDVVGDVVTLACWEKLPFSAPFNWIWLQFWQVIAKSLCQLSYFIEQFKICNNLAARGPNTKYTLKVCHIYITIKQKPLTNFPKGSETRGPTWGAAHYFVEFSACHARGKRWRMGFTFSWKDHFIFHGFCATQIVQYTVLFELRKEKPWKTKWSTTCSRPVIKDPKIISQIKPRRETKPKAEAWQDSSY